MPDDARAAMLKTWTEDMNKHWKAENGIRLTGMPGFKGRLNDTQLWQVSVLLANADKISPAVKTALTNLPPAAPVNPKAVPTAPKK